MTTLYEAAEEEDDEPAAADTDVALGATSDITASSSSFPVALVLNNTFCPGLILYISYSSTDASILYELVSSMVIRASPA